MTIPANYSEFVTFVNKNAKYSSVSGKISDYENTGYFLKYNFTQYAEIKKFLNTVDLYDMTLKLNLQGMVAYGLYFLPAFDQWVVKTNIYEFPKDNDIIATLRVSPIKIRNLEYNSSKVKLGLDILNLLLQLIIGLIKFWFAFKEGKKELAYVFLTFNGIIFLMLLASNLTGFDFYRGRDVSADNLGLFVSINDNVDFSKQILIMCFLLHSYQTFFSLKVNNGCSYILTVISYMQSWLWPLVLQYALVIVVFSFLVDNAVMAFNLSLTQIPIIIFRLIANSNTSYWELIIKESPFVFILVVTASLFWIFYIINNIYFGIQCEIVRLCETAKHGKRLGMWEDLMEIIAKIFRKKKKNTEEEGEEGGEEGEEDQNNNPSPS